MDDYPDDLTPETAAQNHTYRRQHRSTSRPWPVRPLVALSVLALLLGSSCGLVKTPPRAPATAGVPTSTAPALHAQTQVGGLDATLQVVIAGPYFLRELLPVDVSLTNHTQLAVQLLEPPIPADLCHDSALMARLTAGSDPSVVFPPIPIGVSCTNELRTSQVQPGETLTIHQLVPLSRSGAVTLSMQSARVCTPATPPCASATPIPFDPLDGHWPTVQLQVWLQVPQDRALTLQEQPGRVRIEAPAGAQGHLLAMQSVECGPTEQRGPALVVNGTRWTPLATNVLEEATCSSASPNWVYIVSAPGYAIVFGSQRG
jgi:hypothetical protein